MSVGYGADRYGSLAGTRLGVVRNAFGSKDNPDAAAVNRVSEAPGREPR